MASGGLMWRCVGGALICEEIIISERFRGAGFASIREGIPEASGGVAGVVQSEIFIFHCNLSMLCHRKDEFRSSESRFLRRWSGAGRKDLIQ